MGEQNLDDVPTAADIRDGISALRPMIREGYVRSKAYSMYPNNWTAVTAEQEIEAKKDSGNFASVGGLWEVRTNPGSAPREVTGYFRWSDVLGIYMPAPIPDDTDAMCRDETRAAWVASTTGDDDSIDSYASENVRSDLDTIKDAFEEVLAQTRMYAIKAMLDRLNQIAEGLDEIIDNHTGSEFEQLAELWESWHSAEAYVSYEIFGGQVESSAASHRQMFADLIRCASEEGMAQVAALSTLNNALADEQQEAEEALQREGYPWGAGAVGRFSGTVLVNRVPYLGDLLATADFVIEIATQGEQQGLPAAGSTGSLRRCFPSIRAS
ncbi:hypothetical protein GCM10029992_10510 [Glycomyces albus]